MSDAPRCPGQDLRFWKPGDIFEVACPRCGRAVEFWKDDPLRRCDQCGNEIRNPKIDLGCAKWCKFAEQCTGGGDSRDADSARLASRLERIFAALEREFGPGEPAVVARAQRGLEFARKLVSAEGGDPLVVQAAVAVREVAPHARHSGCRPFAADDPCRVRAIMTAAGIDDETIGRICHVVWALVTAQESDVVEFDLAWDAVQLAELSETPSHPAAIRATFRTSAGQSLADEALKNR